MNARVLRIAPLLFFSGMCALIYQTVWMRELRLIFGASTPATAAVLAIFLGGLGVGGVLLGRRSDLLFRPLHLYARLEIGVAVSAFLTPWLMVLIRRVYVMGGGTLLLGPVLATLVRLLLSALVLSVPTILMGGALPAAARAVQGTGDARRQGLAALYGMSTLGGVVGAAISTFLLLEVFGTRTTLFLACLINGLLGMIARILARGTPLSTPDPPAPETTTTTTAEPAPSQEGLPPGWFVLLAAALCGFIFLFMELVWYRMLGPLLGGTVYTFGLVLAMALFGIGLGGVAYALLFGQRPATLRGFAVLCLLQACCLALPYALGDRIAVLALLLRPLGAMGLSGHVIGWSLITAIVVLPAAFVSGVQFPLLIALLGRGGHRVGRQVGLLYGWNTAGALFGSLAGGFGLLPLLSAPGGWQAATYALCAVGLFAVLISLLREGRRLPVAPLILCAVAVLLLQARGPTSAWRHSGIGAGQKRADYRLEQDPISLKDWVRTRRREISGSVEGVESNVALSNADGLAFVINGMADGNARLDAGTQIMGGLLGGLLHGAPRRSLVIGMGTGSTAGWLGRVPGMEQVDVVELEPAVLRVARLCKAVNQDVFANRRVHVITGDAREVLLVTRQRYDVIFSGPSNPYRAGGSSLFTREFYGAARSRLAQGGLFLQWLQTYGVDTQTVRTTYATLASVFPVVETWQTQRGDLLLVAALQPIRYDVPALRVRIAAEPYRSALGKVWHVTDLEGVLAHFVARSAMARDIAAIEEDYINTDDLMPIEFAFARSVGQNGPYHGQFNVEDVWRVSRSRKEDRPEISGGAVDWVHLEDQRIGMFTDDRAPPILHPGLSAEQVRRASAQALHLAGLFPGVLLSWQGQSRGPADLHEAAILGEALAEAGDEAALPYIEKLREFQAVEADAILGRLRLRQGRQAEGLDALLLAFRRFHEEPWAMGVLMGHALDLAVEVAKNDPDPAKRSGVRLFEEIKKPFAVRVLNDRRRFALIDLAMATHFGKLCQEAFRLMEPDGPWRRDFLTSREKCYGTRGNEYAPLARHELDAFEDSDPLPFSVGLLNGE